MEIKQYDAFFLVRKSVVCFIQSLPKYIYYYTNISTYK